MVNKTNCFVGGEGREGGVFFVVVEIFILKGHHGLGVFAYDVNFPTLKRR